MRDPLSAAEQPHHCLAIFGHGRGVSQEDNRAAARGERQRPAGRDLPVFHFQQPLAPEDGVGPQTLGNRDEAVVGHDEYSSPVTHAGLVESPKHPTDIGVVERDRRIARRRFRSKTVVGRVHVIQVEASNVGIRSRMTWQARSVQISS